MQKVYDWVLARTEAALTRRKAVKATAKANRSFLGEIWGWLDALLFAVVVIFLLNQFFVQLFVIPSPSMAGTLEVKDRVMVNKQAYGIEVFPDGPKIFAVRTPDRDDIITFYNPRYESNGPFFDVLSQVLYLATLSFVNIDRDSEGNVKERLYVKRTVGVGGDRVRFVNGDVWIRPSGTDDFIPESQFRSETGLATNPHRSLDTSLYPAIDARARLMAWSEAGISQIYLPSHLTEAYRSIQNSTLYYDKYQHEASHAKAAAQLDPTDLDKRSASAAFENGIYVPYGYVLPLGDNRDNSEDGRYFGPVSTDKVNGKVNFVLWPFTHLKNLV